MPQQPVPLRDSQIATAFRNRPFQKVATQFAVKNRKVIIADQPGLGKTLESIAAVVQNGREGSVLVVSPKTPAHLTWEPELRRWLLDVAPNDVIRVITGNDDKTGRIATLYKTLTWQRQFLAGERGGRQWIITTPNYLRFNYALDDNKKFIYDEHGDKIIVPVREALKGLLAVHWTAVIVDEAHQTLSGAHGDIKKQSAQSRGLRMLSTADDSLLMALSGTPFRGKHENIWGILNWLYPKEYRSYWKWVNRHFFQYQDPVFGQVVLTDIKSEAALNKELSHIMIRRTKAEVAKDLPPKMYGGTPLDPSEPDQAVAVWLPMGKEQRRVYDEMVDSAIAKLKSGTLVANGVLAEIIRLKQFANSSGDLDTNGKFVPTLPSNKFEWLVEFLLERGIDGKAPGESKVLVASQFTRHLLMFQDELNKLGIKTFALHGGTPDKARLQFQEAFQTNSMKSFGEDGPAPDVFLFNTKAGGVGITLDAADDVVIVDQTPIPDDQEQVEDRAHRISRTDHNVSIWNLASLGTLDENIIRHTSKMRASLHQVLDGERGIDIAIKLISGKD